MNRIKEWTKLSYVQYISKYDKRDEWKSMISKPSEANDAQKWWIILPGYTDRIIEMLKHIFHVYYLLYFNDYNFFFGKF